MCLVFEITFGLCFCYIFIYLHSLSFYAMFHCIIITQVLRGGDGMAGFAVRHPNGQLVLPYQWRANADYQEQTSAGGYYHICIDNQFSRFADKLVNLYMTVIRWYLLYSFSDKICPYIQKNYLNILTLILNNIMSPKDS